MRTARMSLDAHLTVAVAIAGAGPHDHELDAAFAVAAGEQYAPSIGVKPVGLDDAGPATGRRPSTLPSARLPRFATASGRRPETGCVTVG